MSHFSAAVAAPLPPRYTADFTVHADNHILKAMALSIVLSEHDWK
jgi:hypothetical protein